MAKTVIEAVTEKIKNRIKSSKHLPHEQLPGERALQEEYGVSADTMRKALARLVADGTVYRIPWRGTFISPIAKVGQLLIVANSSTTSSNDDFGLLFGFPAFQRGLRRYERRRELPFTISNMDRDTYLECAHEIHLIYRNLIGVIFFRDISPLHASRAHLHKSGIPFLFYGSQHYRNQLKSDNTMLCSDANLVHAGLDYLTSKGHKNILCTLNDQGERRYKVYQDWIRKNGFDADQLKPAIIDNGRLVEPAEKLAERGTAILATRDREAVVVLNAAVKANIEVPDTLAIIGIDNYAIGLHTVVPLTSVEIPVETDAERCLRLFTELLEGKIKQINESSKARVVARKSA